MKNIHLELTPDTAELLLTALQNEQARVAPYASTSQKVYAQQVNGFVYQLEKLVSANRLELSHPIIR